MKLNKLSFQKRLHTDINELIIYPAINKSDNLFLNRLSQVMGMKLNMLHLTMCNRIFNNLNCTFISIMSNTRGFNRKTELTKEILNLDDLSTNINYTTILNFHCRQRDYLLFLTRPYQWSRTERKHKEEGAFQSSLSLT
jgi:hypothetical protein